MVPLLQTEIVEERNGRLKSYQATSVGSMAPLGLGAGLARSPLPQGFSISGRFGNVQTPFNYDEIIAREFPPPPATRNVRPHMIVTHRVVSASPFRNRELEWRRTHAETLKSLEKEWVVLEGDQVIAHGNDPVQVVSEAKSKGVRTPYIFFVEQKRENVVIMGL